MTDNKKKSNVINTLFWSIIASVLGYGIIFFVTPYITSRMGLEAYGFVTLTRTFVDYGAIITTALNSYAVRYIAVEFHNGRFKEANKFYNSVLIADVVLAIFLLLISIVFSFTLKTTLKVPDELFTDVQKLFVLTFLNLAINTVMTAFSSAAYLKNKLDVNYIFRTIGYSAEMVSLVLLFSHFDTYLFFIGVAYVVNSIIILTSRIWMIKRWTPELRINITDFRWQAVKQLVVNGVWNSINSLGNILNTGLDILITDLMLSATELGLLGVAKTFPAMLIMLYQLFSQPFQPQMLKCYSVDDKEGLHKNLEMAMKSTAYITLIIFSSFVAIGKDFYSLWLPKQDSFQLYLLTILALLPNAIESVIYPAYYIYTLCIKNKVPCIITILGGLANVGGMYLLIKYGHMGVYAVLITTIVVMSITTFITNPMYMSKCINVKPWFFYRIILKSIFCCCGMSLAMSMVAQVFSINSWLSLVFSTFILIVVGSVIYYIIMFTSDEKTVLVLKLRGKFKGKV